MGKSWILGISALYHDSAAALIGDGEIVAAVQEERFSRKKNDSDMPSMSIDWCLRHAGIEATELAAVAYYDKPLLTFERLLESHLAFAPRGFAAFSKAMPVWLKQKLFIPREIERCLPGFNGAFHFVPHHESHAASAFYPSPFEDAALLTIDGVGEWATTSWGVGSGHRFELRKEIRFPHSLGLLYSAFTSFLGFRVNSGEYKVMGLAPFGKPRFRERIFDNLIDLREDGSYRLDQRFFNYCAGLTMTNSRFHELFEGQPRMPGEPLLGRHADIAASIQQVVQECVLRIARHVRQETGSANLCLAGGVALNCVANGHLLREKVFDRLWIQPAAGDAGGSLGAALAVWHQAMERPRQRQEPDGQRGSYLGPDISREEVDSVIAGGAVPEKTKDQRELVEAIVALLTEGKVVGHCAGRMEFGPRALGNRSILGDPACSSMQKTMNLKIKYRESFRPFAPACLREDANEWFDLDGESPYMLLVAPIQERHRRSSVEKFAGLARVNEIRSELPAITHVDHSARIQTVTADTNARFHAILSEFKAKTGRGVLVNTSFNVRDEPIVCSAMDAYRCFMFTEMDAVVLGDRLFLKERQPDMPGADEFRKRTREVI